MMKTNNNDSQSPPRLPPPAAGGLGGRSASQRAAQAVATGTLGGFKIARPKHSYFSDWSGVARTITADDIPAMASIYFKNLNKSEVTVAVTCTKVYIEGCTDCKFFFSRGIITSTLEAWRSDRIALHVTTPIYTLQLDICQGVEVHMANASQFGSLVWTETSEVSIHFVEGNETFTTGVNVVQPGATGSMAETDQYIVRRVDGALRCEAVIRLPGGFASTEREDKEFVRNQNTDVQ
ncbi:hypothetical protein DFJ73DRAFT_809518 [Zopfochytrium polystomum]|nr:hypothetical protein DFJ73DRAFT_809518 [Zopfochytrium polystomum]